jgi:hypothetical protein
VATPGRILPGVVDIAARNRFVLRTSSASVFKESNTTSLIDPLKIQRKISKISIYIHNSRSDPSIHQLLCVVVRKETETMISLYMPSVN